MPKVVPWMHPASASVASAMQELLVLRRQAKGMAARAAELQNIIITGKGGSAYGMRAAIRYTSAFSGYRKVNTKARYSVAFLPMPVDKPKKDSDATRPENP